LPALYAIHATVYLHLSHRHLQTAVNPLDQLAIHNQEHPPQSEDKATLGGGRRHPYRRQRFRERNGASLTWPQVKVLRAIARCPTAAPGGHLVIADSMPIFGQECLLSGTIVPQTVPHLASSKSMMAVVC
jgi:hypothetical protein